MELHELTNLMNEAVSKFQDQDYLKSLQGDEGFEVISKGLNLLEERIAKEKPELRTEKAATKRLYICLTKDQDYLKSLRGDEGFEVISKGLNLREERIGKLKPNRFPITSGSNHHIGGVNVGGWEAVWLAAFGKLGPAFSNFVTLIETGRGKRFEAWMNLEEKRMAALSIFSCGGVALGGCISHKLGDGGSASTFLSVWSAMNRGSSSRDFETLIPNLAKASLLFPPRNDLPRQLFSMIDDLWFGENNETITKRFVFEAKAIETLRDKAKSDSDSKPSRTRALSSFIWKRYMATSLAILSSPRPCFLRHAVNLRARTKPRLVDGAIENLIWCAEAVANPEADTELHELANLISEAVRIMDDQNFLESMQGNEGFQAISDGLNKLENILAEDKPDRFAITSWSGLGLGVDFGTGAPVWLGAFGKVGPAFMNFATLVEAKWSEGSLEAWINLDEKRMAILAQDPEFLAYASPNPKIVIKPEDLP
ncbi:unnamed protein product [Dovyalis caffra]|uniref:Uncharacterized protein n=1 Tax=Dovyalis caffra TaxID=77055 RepID=A0AAV1QZ60_9ROSI|nr:unnamed protein product [Dovyalis caffra]